MISGCPFTFLLQAWRKYDSDRSGYIESNELKVKYEVCVTQRVNAAVSAEQSLPLTLPCLSAGTAGTAARSVTHKI